MRICNQLYVFMHIVGKEKPKLDELDNHIVPWWAPQWRKLGKELKIGDNLMKIIEHDYPNDCERCCNKLLSDWLDIRPTASWEDLIIAVDNLSLYDDLASNGILLNTFPCLLFPHLH